MIVCLYLWKGVCVCVFPYMFIRSVGVREDYMECGVDFYVHACTNTNPLTHAHTCINTNLL